MSSLLLSALDAIYDTNLFHKSFWKFIYDWVAREQPEAFRMMNYGYLEDEQTTEDLRGEELCRRLYLHVAGTIDLSGKTILDVGAGRGGGLVHVKQALSPKAAFGLDLSPKEGGRARAQDGRWRARRLILPGRRGGDAVRRRLLRRGAKRGVLALLPVARALLP